jgi:cysteinyl-tRNA synthetase
MLRIYNSLTKKKEEFKPINEGKVGTYICGLTVYDVCHIGHARTLIVSDAIVRYLKFKGYDVTYVRNFTDVDDKIIARALKEGVDSRVISERYIADARQDMKALKLIPPTHEPKVTDHIGEIIALIERLVDRGFAYAVDGNVYFEVSKFADYGKLSKRSPEELEAGARIEIDPRKRNPMDFALWKASKPGEPKWPSPWGEGRPGWHIECSAMSMKYLGETFDIHGGGLDLVFPHHENEIAQSEAATGRPWVHYWIHSGMLNVNRVKMSKSLGNYITIKQALEKYHPEVIRFYILNHHYSSPVDFSDDFVREKEQGLEKIYAMLKDVDTILKKGGATQTLENEIKLLEENFMAKLGQAPHKALKAMDDDFSAELEQFRSEFFEAMDDDFNTGEAIGVVYKVLTDVNKYLAGRPMLAEGPTVSAARVLSKVREFFNDVGQIFGILEEEPQQFLAAARERRLREVDLPLEEIDRLILERNEARRKKDWARADAIRQELAAHRITLQDSPDGTTWTAN